MKKTIVLIILAVYIASIAVVNFFGLQVRIFDGVTYVKSIQCDTVTFHGDNSKEIKPIYKGDMPIFVFDFIPPSDPSKPYTADRESLNENPNVIQINYEIMPHNADETGVKFEYDENSGVAVYTELEGGRYYFIFLKPDAALTVTIRATDGSNVSTQITIYSRATATNG